MIKVEDLRVGNYLLDEHGEIFQVKQIGTGLIESHGMHIYEIEEIKPIELTEEILLNCGFEKDESWGMLFIKRPYLVYHDKYLKTNILGVFISGSSKEYQTVSKPFHYLHQLQNLYFALCNEELNIKL